MLKSKQVCESGCVSVLIPLYNHAAYVEQCLDSVLAQGPKNIELLLIDDGSSDNGFDLALRWKERHGAAFKRIVFEKQMNAGITQTFDRLIRKSTGDYLAIVASDDVLMPDSIADRLAVLQEPGILGVFGDAVPVDMDGKVIGKSAIGELGNPASRSALSDPRTIHWELIFRWNVYGSVLLARREALISADGKSVLNLEIFSEDMQLYYSLGSSGALRYLNKPVALYRIHAASASHSTANLKKLQRNVYQSRKHARRGMPFARHCIVGLQAFTYHRWNERALIRYAALPFVVAAYGVILGSRIFYDWYRVVLLRQSRGS